MKHPVTIECSRNSEFDLFDLSLGPHVRLIRLCLNNFSVSTQLLYRGAFKYYVIKDVGGWVGQMMMFDDKVGGWEWLNDDVIKKYTRKKNFSSD